MKHKAFSILPSGNTPAVQSLEFALTPNTLPNTTQVRIRAIIPGFIFHPTEWIEADKLILIPTPDPHENHHQGQRPPH